ncbi:MAG TPA: hypothetical protein VHC46_09580 [Thermodesulfobacteriota bacterium]|nr:hypothetical protein [Thermodesulfobacteriota bacterium]
MKIKDPIITVFSLLVLLLLAGAVSGCFWKGDEVKFSKVSEPESVSASCTQKQGLDQDLTNKLAKMFKHYDGEITDEFKLAAETIVSESNNIDAKDRNTVLKEYFSCLAASSSQKK